MASLPCWDCGRVDVPPLAARGPRGLGAKRVPQGLRSRPAGTSGPLAAVGWLGPSMPPGHRAPPALALPLRVSHPLPVALWGAGDPAEQAAQSPTLFLSPPSPASLWDLQVPLLSKPQFPDLLWIWGCVGAKRRFSNTNSPPPLVSLPPLTWNSHHWAPEDISFREERISVNTS